MNDIYNDKSKDEWKWIEPYLSIEGVLHDVAAKVTSVEKGMKEVRYHVDNLIDMMRTDLVKETRIYLKAYLDGKLNCTCEDCNKIREKITAEITSIIKGK